MLFVSLAIIAYLLVGMYIVYFFVMGIGYSKHGGKPPYFTREYHKSVTSDELPFILMLVVGWLPIIIFLIFGAIFGRR